MKQKITGWLFSASLILILLCSVATPAFADITKLAGVAFRSNATCSGSTTTNCPHYRQYDNAADAFGSDITLETAGSPVRTVWLKASPTTGKLVLVALSADGTLDSYVCTGNCQVAGSWVVNHDFADIWSAEPATADRPFDMAFEQTSGDLVIVYDKVSTTSGQEVFTRTMTSAGTAFGSETAVNTQTADSATDRVYPFIRMAADLTGDDQIGAVMFDTSNDDVNAMIWSGSAWGDNAAVTTASAAIDEEQIGISWERNSGHLVVVGGAAADVGYREFTTSWQTAGTVGGVATGVGNVNWLSMKPTPRTAGNEVYLGILGDLGDFATIQWSGTAWGTGTEHDASVDGHASRIFDIAMSPAADGDGATVDALLVWGTASGSVQYRSWSATNTYGTASNFANAGTHLWVQFPYGANPTAADNIDTIGGTLDSAFDVSRIEWTGGANAPADGAAEDDITADTTVTTFESFSVEFFANGFTMTSANSDTATFTESRVNTLTKPLSDTGTFTESRTSGITKVASDTGIFTESAIKAIIKPLSDTATFTESAAAGLLIIRAISDTSTFTESSTRTLIKALSDTGTYTESTTLATLKVLSETNTFTESQNSLMTFIRAVSDTTTFTESTNNIVSFIRALSDTTTFTESHALAMTKVVVETMTFTENEISKAIVKAVVESATYTESLTTNLIPGAVPDEGGGGIGDWAFPDIFTPPPTAPTLPGAPIVQVIPPTFALVPGEPQVKPLMIKVDKTERLIVKKIEVPVGYEWIKLAKPLPVLSQTPVLDVHQIEIPLEVVVPPNITERTAVEIKIYSTVVSSPPLELVTTTVIWIGDPYNNNDAYWVGGGLFVVVVVAIMLKKRRR